MKQFRAKTRSFPVFLLTVMRGAARAFIPARVRRRAGRLSVYRYLVGQLPWEPDSMALLRRTVEPGWTAIDVGGHVGRFTTELAQLVGPTGHVLVFEPHPDNVRIIRKRVASKNLSGRIDIIQTAVSDGAAPNVELYSGRNMSSAEWNIVGIDVEGNRQRSRLEVPAISLDAFIGANQPVDFVKIDIEGAEHLALRGMVRILAQQRPVLFIEFHPQTDYRECCDILRAANYSVFKLDGTQAAPYPAPASYHVLAKPTSAGS